MKLLNLKFDEIYEFKNIIELFNSEVSLKLINLAWYSSNQEDNIILTFGVEENKNSFKRHK